jgi:hypothetical protein
MPFVARVGAADDVGLQSGFFADPSLDKPLFSAAKTSTGNAGDDHMAGKAYDSLAFGASL